MTDMTEARAFLVLNALPDIGPITTNRLLEHFGGDVLRLFTASARELEEVKGVGVKISGNLRRWSELVDLPKEELRLAEAGAGGLVCFFLGARRSAASSTSCERS